MVMPCSRSALRPSVSRARSVSPLALHAGQVVLQHGLAVHQQAADQRALAVVHAAAGDELAGRKLVIFGRFA
jgi:hypothetical protein